MPSVIGIGSTFVDYFFEADKKFLKDYKLKPEDDVFFEDKGITLNQILSKLTLLSKSPGGMSTNTTAVLSKLGEKAGFYGIVGQDENEKIWKEKLPNVDLSHVKTLGTTSVCACILTGKQKHRLFISSMNHADNLFFDNVDYLFLNSAKLIHVSPFLLDPEGTIPRVAALLEKIDKPQISFTPSLIYSWLGLKAIEPIIKNVDIIFFNTEELKALTNKSPKIGSKILLKCGPKIVVCTMGKKGVLITTQDMQFLTKTRPVKKIVDSTGAGDAFAAGFLFGILNKKTLQWSASFGNKVASNALTDYGLSWLKDFKPSDL